MYKNVMVVDDNPIDRYVAQRIMERMSFADQVLLMPSADDALKHLQEVNQDDETPQILFLDINMPGKNGFQFLEDYNSLPESKKSLCKVVMLTTSSHPDDMQKAAQNPLVFNYIHKPITPDKLISIQEKGSMDK